MIQGAGSQTRSALKLLPTFEAATATATRYTIPLLLRSHYYILYLSKLRWLPHHNDSGRRRRRSLQNGRREAFLIHPFSPSMENQIRSRKTIPFRLPPPNSSRELTIQTFSLPFIPSIPLPSLSPIHRIFLQFLSRG